jgi:hypothetical protein
VESFISSSLSLPKATLVASSATTW